MGRIVRPHGIRGAVIVDAESDFPSRFSPGARMLVEKGQGHLEEVVVESCTPHKGFLLISFSGVAELEQAQALRGRYLMIPGEMASPLGDGEYWVHQLFDMRVTDERGKSLGVVAEIKCGRYQDLLIVRDSKNEEFGIPFISEFVKGVDLEKSTITVRVIEGMVP